MRATISLFCLVMVLSLTSPAEAQLREDPGTSAVRTQLYDTSSDVLDKIFSDEHFRMSHSYQMSMSSFGGRSSSMGMYTNSMMWQFNQAWAARVDVSLAHPFSQNSAFGPQQTKVFLQNAEVAYRPSENMEFRFQVQQSPYGRYMSPYGAYSPYGYRGGFGQMHHTPSSQLFWKN
jgi:hypothetical protein